jgi:thiol-disulfide isomerase/thioredoxin
MVAADRLVLEVYTAHGCCLCDDARDVLDPLARELDVDVRWIHIDGDPALEAAWREQLPAGVLAGRKVFKYRVDPALLRRHVAKLRS